MGTARYLSAAVGYTLVSTAVAANHHFLLPVDTPAFRFAAGKYRVDVFARILHRRKPLLLFSRDLDVSAQDAEALSNPDTGLYFDWGPDSGKYYAHLDTRPPANAGPIHESADIYVGPNASSGALRRQPKSDESTCLSYRPR